MSPRDGRVQYRVAQSGEVLSAGGRVLNLVDLGAVYMTFFLPTAAAGRVGVGAEVRLSRDASRVRWIMHHQLGVRTVVSRKRQRPAPVREGHWHHGRERQPA